MTLKLVEVRGKKELKRFIRLPRKIYSTDPHWIPPLELERVHFFNPKKNPFYKKGEAALFMVSRGNEFLGRLSVQVHQGHLKRHKDEAGFFGFFESVEDQNAAQLLFEGAQDWLKKRGLKKMRGPFNFTMYDNETGILIDGFDTPPSIMMNHNPPYYASLLEAAGFKKNIDLFAWDYPVGEIREEARQLADLTLAYPGLKIRSIEMRNFRSEVSLMMKIFNEAWEENLGFVPTTEEEILYIAKMLKPILDPQMAIFAFVNGDPAGFGVFLPNLNEAIRDLRGRLFPLGWAKLLWRLKKGLKSGRFCLMGIRKPYRGSKLGSLSILINVEMHRRAILRGYLRGELGWTLENNDRINRGIEFMGGRKYKTYRIYEKEI